MRLNMPKFIKSAIKPADFPRLTRPDGTLMPEIAVAGRSNVGKSSLLNHLFQKRGFVKTSSTPGKTQLLNFFTVDDAVCFVDLPGYGYASVPLEVRKKWGPMVQNYLEGRESLVAILFLFDIRRLPNEEDLQLMEWIGYNQLPMILVLTKCDKVRSNEKVKNTKMIVEAFGNLEMPLIHYSATKNLGRNELIQKIHEVLS